MSLALVRSPPFLLADTRKLLLSREESYHAPFPGSTSHFSSRAVFLADECLHLERTAWFAQRPEFGSPQHQGRWRCTVSVKDLAVGFQGGRAGTRGRWLPTTELYGRVRNFDASCAVDSEVHRRWYQESRLRSWKGRRVVGRAAIDVDSTVLCSGLVWPLEMEWCQTPGN